MNREWRLKGRAETERWGQALGRLLQSGDVLALVGDLGAGKTTLTQAIGRGMALEAPVTSPTYTLVHEYPGPLPLFHFDPYRLDAPEQMADVGFEEYLERSGVVLVEWADKILPLLPSAYLRLELEIESGDPGAADTEEAPRHLTVTALGERYEELADHMADLPNLAGAGEV